MASTKKITLKSSDGGDVALGVVGGAAVKLHNYVAGIDHPSMLKNQDIVGISNRCVSYVLSPGGDELKGDEGNRILSFKISLGIDDSGAADMHRGIKRQHPPQLIMGDLSPCLSPSGLRCQPHFSRFFR